MGDVDQKIKVVVRVRDLIGREKDQLKAFTVQDATDIVQKNTNKSWSFDRVYSKLDNNRTVYSDTAAEIIEQTVSGFNTTIFAYGQTSSGKTHTMHGNPQEPGVIGMAVEQLFFAVEDTPDRRFLMQVSYLEIYNETVIDLLSDPKSRAAGGLKVRENEEGDVYVENLEQKTVTSPEEIHRYMKLGEKSRHVGQTKMNDKSSRSHTIFRITLESTNRLTDDDTMEDAEEGRQVTVSQLNLVDLAGSEKAAQTGAGGARLKEGCNINQSLMVLGQVIQKLSGGDKGHINFRDSKLTRILQNSIGGNAKTAIICTVTPAAMSEEQTISTLRFASQAKTIQNHATVNEVLDDQAQINRLKKDMAKLMKELEQQKKEANTDMVQEMREQLERERMEKEEHVRKIRELQEKVITSSQPAPPRKSMMFKKKERRETWCGPAMKRNMRMSFAPHKFLKPLLPLDINLPVLAEDPFPIQTDSMANLSLASADFNMSHNTMEQQLDNMEAKRLNELDLMEEDESYMVDESVFDHMDAGTSLQVDRKRAVKFVSSPQFLSPRRKFNSSIADLNLTDNGTPKAVIRDKYKRVSIALTSREVELDRERQARLDLEREHLELQEFTRLESESGVEDERRMSVVSGGSDADLTDKLKWFEKSFKDSERLNIELGKELSESKQESSKLKLLVEDLTEKFETVSMKEEVSAEKLTELLPLVQEVKELREKTVELEKNKMDFDMQMEMAVEKKETAIVDLRKYLESAYEEIATLESGNKEDVRGRLEKMRNLGKRVEALEVECKEKDKLVEDAEIMKDEYEGLKEGMEVVTAEMIKLSEDKVALEDEVKSLQSRPEQGDNSEFVERLNIQEAEIVRILGLLQSKTVEISNLELSNASLLETVDELSRKTEENVQKNSELLVSSAELERFNVELTEEIGQLKVEVKEAAEVKDKLEVENQELRTELEEVMTSKTDLEEFINKSQITEEIEEMKKDLKNMEEQKSKLEAMLKAEERSVMINKLSATLNSIEESFIAVEETNKTCADESPGNNTFASVANSTFGVPLEVVEEMKNQLLSLQQQLINFSPEELERKVMEIEEMKKENAQLYGKVEELNSKMAEDNQAPADLDKLFEERVNDMKAKHKAEIAIITTKMREEMNFNMPALEEKLRDEYEEKKQEALKENVNNYENKLSLLQEDLKKSEVAVVELQEQLKKSQVEVKSAAESLSSQKNTTLGVVPVQRLESLNTTDNPYVTCEMSFDDTLGSSSMNMTMETNAVFSGGIGDSLQVQMLKGELEMIKNTLEEKEQIIENLMEKASENRPEFPPECAREQNIHEELDLVKKMLVEKEELIQEMKKVSMEPMAVSLESDSVNESLADVEKELEEAKKSLEEKSKPDEKESDEMKRKVDECQETIKELQNEISEFETLRVKGEEYIKELIAQCDKLEETVEKNEELEELNEDLNKKMVEGKLQFESLNSNIEALTTQIKSLEDLVETKSQELESMGELKDENVKLAGNLEEVSLESDNLKSALAIEVEKVEVKENELKAARDLWAELESMKEGDSQKNSRLKELENLVEEAEKKVFDLGADNLRLELAMKAMETEKINLVENDQRTRDSLEDANVKARNLEEGLENAMSDLESAIIEKETAQELMGQFEIKISELSDAVATSNTVQDELRLTQANLVQELDAAKTRNGELVKTNSQLTLEIDNLAVDTKRFEETKAELEGKISKLDENIRVLNQEKENEKTYYEKCLQDSKSDSTLVATMSSKLAEMETKYDEEVSSKLELESKFLGLLENLKDEKTDLEKHLNAKESEFITGINEKEAILSKLSEENSNLDNLVKSLKSDAQNSATEMKAAESKIEFIENEIKEKINAETHLQSRLSEQVAALDKIKSLVDEKEAAEAELKSKLKDKTAAAETLLVELKERTDEIAVFKTELEANKLIQSSSVSLQEQVASLQKDLESVQAELAEVEKQRDTVNDECDKLETKLSKAEKSLEITGQKVTEVEALENQVATLTTQLKESINVVEENKALRAELAEVKSKVESAAQHEAKIDDLETQVERLKFDLGEAEKLRDIVDAECDKLESELEETKVKLVELNTTQDVGTGSAGQVNSLQSTMIAGQQTLLNNVSMDCTFIPVPDNSYKVRELELEKEQLERELNDLKRQLASTPTEEKYVNLKSQLIKQKEYSDKVYEETKQLKGLVTMLQEKAVSSDTMSALEVQLAEVKEELGRKNIEYASLKVDVEKGELQYKKKCEILQADLDYEKTNSTRLTQEIRRFQSSAMDTTVINPKAQTRTAEVSSAACNTSATTAGSPVWSSGSGAIKEIRLHSAEMRVKSLEKENSKLKEHEEFYINKAREWKSRALKYEKTLEQNGVTVPSKENRRETLQGAGAANTSTTSTKATEKVAQALPPVDPATAKVYQAAGLSPRTSANPLKDLQNLRAETGPSPPTPTEDIKLVLSRRSETRRTEEDFRLPDVPGRGKPDDCKTQ